MEELPENGDDILGYPFIITIYIQLIAYFHQVTTHISQRDVEISSN